jgi:hypothetical protein
VAITSGVWPDDQTSIEPVGYGADACTAQHQHIVQKFDALDAIHLGCGQPGELADIPAAPCWKSLR